MCTLVREPQAAPERGGAAAPSASVRPRWAGAAVAMLVGGLAVAALVVPSPQPSEVKASATVPFAPLVSKSDGVPLTPVVEQRSSLMDDGVPAAPDVANAKAGNCSHGM